MKILWLICFSAVVVHCNASLARTLVPSISKDIIGRGTQYRFQYFVRDESGDYKTQEEAGEGSSARGSYAVEEPDGNLRIVQYTTNLEGGFKAHVKVDHAGKSPAKMQEIDIPAAEMRKLIAENRAKTEKPAAEIQASKSYALGPPKKMSDIVMEQAAAIREILSKEMKAEEEREAKEQLKLTNNTGQETAKNSPAATRDAMPGIKRSGSRVETSHRNRTSEKVVDKSNVVEVTKSNTDVSNEKGKISVSGNEQQSPVVRVVFDPNSTTIESDSISDRKDLGNTKETSRESPIPGKQAKADRFLPITNLSSTKAVQNVKIKNQILFYKPAGRNGNHSSRPNSEGGIRMEGVPRANNDESMDSLTSDEGSEPSNDDQIMLYSPYQEEGTEGHRKSKYVTVPYKVLRPYLKQFAEDE